MKRKAGKDNMMRFTLDKEVLMVVQKEIGEWALGYNMKDEKFVARRLSDLTVADPSTVFGFVGATDIELVGRVAAYLNLIGFKYEELASAVGLSVRTLHRYIKLNEI